MEITPQKALETGTAALPITPFADESIVLQINGLTVENRLDRVALYGSIDLTLDRPGIDMARRLKAVVDAVVEAQEEFEKTGKLPAAVRVDGTKTVKNPLK
jgi:hypothetical protein